MGQHAIDQTCVTLEQTQDPVTGELIFALPETSNLPAIRPSTAIAMREEGLVEESRSSQPVQLPDRRFAGQGPIDWAAAEKQQASGQVVSMIDGQLVVGQGTGPSQQVALPSVRFAAPNARFDAENAEIVNLARAGAGVVVKTLKHTAQIPNWPAGSPTGWVYTSQPSINHGDELTGLIAFNSSTGLYHLHFWRFDVRGSDGRMGAVDLPAYLNKHPHLTMHRTHMYSGTNGDGILCLSTSPLGGLPTLSDVVFQAAKWADGMGNVVRGRPFPYAE